MMFKLNYKSIPRQCWKKKIGILEDVYSINLVYIVFLFTKSEKQIARDHSF